MRTGEHLQRVRESWWDRHARVREKLMMTYTRVSVVPGIVGGNIVGGRVGNGGGALLTSVASSTFMHTQSLSLALAQFSLRFKLCVKRSG